MAVFFFTFKNNPKTPQKFSPAALGLPLSNNLRRDNKTRGARENFRMYIQFYSADHVETVIISIYFGLFTLISVTILHILDYLNKNLRQNNPKNGQPKINNPNFGLYNPKKKHWGRADAGSRRGARVP